MKKRSTMKKHVLDLILTNTDSLAMLSILAS